MARVRVLIGVLAALALTTPAAQAAFPFPEGAPKPYDEYALSPAQPVPGDLGGNLTFMYASTAEAGSPFVNDKQELGGVRGAHLVDADRGVAQGWATTTGRPDVTIAVTDSGIEWDNRDAVQQIRRKTRISTGETPVPQADRSASLEAGQDCATFTGGVRDANHDGVFNVVDYACDSRVSRDPAKGVGPADLLDPQDVLIAFSDGTDADGNGYVDDIVGWDFLDDDNDPFDDVGYGHGTGEAQDSTAEADNGGTLGTCPNCMVIHLRVGTSFVADVNRFAEAVVYATDNQVYVVQDALGTLNKSKFALDAIKYAYDHGTTVIASAADEAAQHHNQPSAMPYSIVVNSVTHLRTADNPSPPDPLPPPPGTPSAVSYLQFNGCTNFSSRIQVAIPSVSCSSDATGRGAGMAGLVYSEALNQIARGQALPHPISGCIRVGGASCPISPNEVRQVMASGLIGGEQVADDVNFAVDKVTGTRTELACLPTPAPACTDPFQAAPTTRPGEPGQSYPARKGHDQFYGYGRVNMVRALAAVKTLPPEVEVTSPNWFDTVDPAAANLDVQGILDNRGAAYTCKVFAAAGSYAGDYDFKELPGVSQVCDGTTPHTERITGPIASIPMATLKALFPPSTQFDGREPGTGAQTYGGRPNTEPYGFVVKVVATAGNRQGQDRRQAYLHRDADMLDGFPKQLPGDVESSPVLADLDGDNENELVLANSDGVIHAFERAGGEVPGWPQTTGALRPGHLAAAGLGPESGAVDPNHEAVLATPAVGDLDGDGRPEVVVADLDRRVRIFASDGTLERTLETNPRYAGISAQPFVNLRHGNRNRTQEGAIAAPVLADLDGDGKQEIILASMDRHLYAWHADGSAVDGFPVLVVDRTKVQSIDPVSHQITFKDPPVDGKEDAEQQGAIVDTPAVGDLVGDARPEIVVGTNEEYPETINAGSYNEAEYAPLGAALAPGNGRLFALKSTGVPEADALKLSNDVYVPGWPFKVGILQRGLLPLVGEGINGGPTLGVLPCGQTTAVRVGTIPAAGLPYLINADGRSCYGQTNGKDVALPTSGGPASDPIFLGAVGHPAIGTLAGKPSFLAPAAGVVRASDVVLPEYQGGRDYLAAWDTASGQLAPGWPAQVNDLQFLTGPSLADIDGVPGSEVFDGSASDDLQGLSGAGTPIDTSWPKLTGDWTVTIPVIGPWGGGPSKVLVSGTRSGRLMAYDTGAALCAGADWPEFHHDPANSGDARRDAFQPGHPTTASVDGNQLKFTATGDDLQCGTANRYEVATADTPITPATFAAATPVPGAVVPKAAGQPDAVTLPTTAGRYVAVRAIDEQGNVGRPVSVDRGANPPPIPAVTPTATPTGSPAATASSTATTSPSPAATTTPQATTTPSGGPAPGPCSRLKRGTRRSNVLRGTRRGDRILGRGGNDRLFGGAGADCLYGGSGNDQLHDGGGFDKLYGGPGRDKLFARGSRRDTLDCGPGRDIAVVDRFDTVTRCEDVRRK